jgi:amino-acid N-acetyltransferase
MLLRLAKEGDRAEVEALLNQAGLPGDGVGEHFNTFIVAEDRARIVGVAGLEMYGVGALLRSVAVKPDVRGTGLGALLVRQAFNEAKGRGVDALYLLTTTAQSYFPRFGFEQIAREHVPAGVQESREFRGACPSSAVVMRAALEGVVNRVSAR